MAKAGGLSPCLHRHLDTAGLAAPRSGKEAACVMGVLLVLGTKQSTNGAALLPVPAQCPSDTQQQHAGCLFPPRLY